MVRYNFLQRFLFWLAGARPDTEVKYRIDPELVEQNRVAIQRLNSVEAQLAEFKAKEREKKELEKQEDTEYEIAKHLQEEEKKLTEEEMGELTSLNKFYAKLYGVIKDGREMPNVKADFNKRSKWGKSIIMTDKDGEKEWGFGEISISSNGFFVITDLEGNRKVISPDLRKLIYKPQSFSNQLKMGRLMLPVDKNGVNFPELDDMKILVPLWSESEQAYKISKNLQKKAIDLIKEKETKIREQDNQIEYYEEVISNLKRSMTELERGGKYRDEMYKVAIADTSKAVQDSIASTKYNSDLIRDKVALSEDKVMLEQRLGAIQESLKKAVAEIEQTGSKTEFKKAMGLLKDTIGYTKDNTIILTPEYPNVKIPESSMETNQQRKGGQG